MNWTPHLGFPFCLVQKAWRIRISSAPYPICSYLYRIFCLYSFLFSHLPPQAHGRPAYCQRASRFLPPARGAPCQGSRPALPPAQRLSAFRLFSRFFRSSLSLLLFWLKFIVPIYKRISEGNFCPYFFESEILPEPDTSSAGRVLSEGVYSSSSPSNRS